MSEPSSTGLKPRDGVTLEKGALCLTRSVGSQTEMRLGSRRRRFPSAQMASVHKTLSPYPSFALTETQNLLHSFTDE